MLHFSKWKILLTVAVLLLGTIYAMPNLFTEEQLSRLPSWVPHQRVSLGLDLQGGSHLLLEADVDSIVRERLDSIVDSVRIELRKANIGYTDLGVDGDRVTVHLRDTNQIDQAREVLRGLAGNLDVAVASDGLVTIGFSDKAKQDLLRQVMAQSIEVIRRRIDETGVREATIVQQGSDRILLQVPGVKDPERLKKIVGETAKMTFRLVRDVLPAGQKPAGAPPAGTEFLPDAETDASGNPVRYYVVERRVMVSGENLVDAQPSFQQNEPVVSFRFDSVGAKRFGDATRENVGRPFAIVLDGKVISAPTIREPILGGSGVISGSFTVQSAQDLALLLRAGALPVPLTVVEERTVGAELGADSIAAGKTASIMGLALICGALILTYGLFGVFANIALVFNFILLLAAMSILQATLTLPGIAGMVLSLGMAVDANVLIHERIREEIRAGRGPARALEEGYRAASGTIMDSNLTVIISSVFLYIFGSGTVKGFAVTLIIGTIVSMFTAVVVARLCTVIWFQRTRPKALPI
jgi:protein-export membrane protein SecD